MSLPTPAGYVAPPRAQLRDSLRSLRVLFTDLVPYLGKLALYPNLPSTNSVEGLAGCRVAFGRPLRRLGIELVVEHAERIPASGGLLFMWNQESHLDHLVLAAAILRPLEAQN